MKKSRPTAVAGMFYPDSPQQLKTMIEQSLNQASSSVQIQQPKVLIVPHAGYIYSADIAANAYQYLKPFVNDIHHIVLIGPSHRVAFPGLALSSADYFETPLGDVEINSQARQKLMELEGIDIIDQAHVKEHSLEVQLPFLQHIINRFTLSPIVAGNASPQLVAEAIQLLWGGPETVIIISSDLSHYHDYQAAQVLDQTTTQAILDFDINKIDSQQACGCVGIRGLLHFAHQHPLKASLVDLRNSGDTAGDKDRVVGYGAYVFEEQNHVEK